MKFTVVFVTVLSISWGLKVQDDPKDKREAPVGYHGGGGGQSSGYQSSPSFGGSGSGGQSSHSFQSSPSFGHGEASAISIQGGSGGQSGHSFQSSPSFSHGDASNAISIGAGYSIGGGAKPTYVYGAPEGGHQLQLSSEGLPSSGHATIQLPPIMLQPGHGGLQSSDLHELMQQLSQGLNSGSLQLSPSHGEGHGSQGGHEQQYAIQQFSLGEPKQQQQYVLQPEQAYASVPSYAAGHKGLGSYGSTGPVLFTPSPASESHGEHQALTYGAPSAGGHSFDASAFSNAGSLGGITLGEGGHGFGGHSLGGSGHSFGGLGQSGLSLGGASLAGLSGHSLGLSGLSGHSLGGLSLGGSGHSFGGLMKGYGGGYILSGKPSFKPSVYLGGQAESGHSFAGLSGSHGAPSFAGHSISGGHGLSLSSGSHGPSFGSSHGSFGAGSSKFIAPSYLPPKSKGFGGSHDSVSAFSSSHVSPPRTTYGHPSGSSSLHSASSHSPKYYMSSAKFPSFEGSSSFKAPSGHSLSSFSSGPKYSFGSRSGPSSHYGAPKDIEGSYSENSYNTIKYSEELKPRA